MKTIQYGLRYKKDGKLLRVAPSSTEGGAFCVSVAHKLNNWSDSTWLVGSPEHAEYVRHHNTPWYNSGYDTPINNYDAADLQVVEVTTEIEEAEVCVNIPTFEEYMQYRYNTEGGMYYNPQHYSYIMSERDKAKGTKRKDEFCYSLYDLKEYLREKEEKTKPIVEKA